MGFQLIIIILKLKPNCSDTYLHSRVAAEGPRRCESIEGSSQGNAARPFKGQKFKIFILGAFVS